MKFSYRFVLAAMMAGALSTAMAQDENVEMSETEALRQRVEQLEASQSENELQDKYKSIWHRTKTFRLGFSSSSWTPKGCAAFKPNYGFSMSLNNTYFVHKNPIAGMLKFGIEATWFDLNYVNYKANPDWSAFINDDYDPDYGYNPGWYEDEELDEPNLGSHQLDVALGVGVSAHIAPFSSFDSALNELRAKVYCNFLPSFSAMLISEPDDTRFNYAFVPYVTFGMQVQWKVLSLFVEGRWGSANYKIGGLDDSGDYDYDDDFNISDAIHFDKISCKNAGVRVGIGLSF